MAYEPTPGTIVHRVIELMRQHPPGTELSTGDICTALELNPASFSTLMGTAKQHGTVRAVKRGKAFWWCLPGAAAAPAPDDQRVPKVVPGWTPPKMVAPRPGSEPIPSRAPTAAAVTFGPQPDDPAEQSEPEQPAAPPADAFTAQAVVLGEDADGVVDRAEQDPDAVEGDEPPEFNACVWADGEVTVYGAQANVDGSFTLTRDQAQTLRRLTAWMPA